MRTRLTDEDEIEIMTPKGQTLISVNLWRVDHRRPILISAAGARVIAKMLEAAAAVADLELAAKPEDR